MGITATVLTALSAGLVALNVWLRARGATGRGYKVSVYGAATLAFLAMVLARVGWVYVGLAILPLLVFGVGLWQVATLANLSGKRY